LTLAKELHDGTRKIVSVVMNQEKGEIKIKDFESGKIIPMNNLSKLFKSGFRKIEDEADMFAKAALQNENNNMSAQKLGVFAKGKNKVSLWEHNGVVVLVDNKSQKLQETKTTVKEAVDQLYDRGYIVEGIDIHTLTNSSGEMLRVFADTVKKTSTVRDANGGSNSYQVPGEKLLHILRQKGYEPAKDAELSLTPKDDRASNGSMALAGGGHEMNLMNSEEMDPEDGEDELMAGRRSPRYGFQKRKLKY